MLCGQIRYTCTTCYDNVAGPAYDLCPRCFEAEGSTHEHPLQAVPVEVVPKDTTDKDGLIDSPFFETRVKFLNLCQVRAGFCMFGLLLLLWVFDCS